MTEKMNTNIKDVAKIAGVSATTVSAYLNKSSPVKKETADKIKNAIEQTNYKPNLIAKSLRQKKLNVIGLIVGNILSHFYSVIAKSVEDTARKGGFNTILCNGDDDPIKELEYLRVLESLRVGGIILTPTGENRDYIASLIKSGIKIVFIDRDIDDFDCSSVLVDNESGAEKAVKHLVDMGYKKIGIINGNLKISTARERYKGYINVLSEAGLPINKDLIKIGDFKMETGMLMLKEMLEGKNKPEAVFSTNLEITKGILTTIKKKGLKIPDDIGIVGFDDSDLTQLFNPSITVISQPVYKIGSAAIEIIINEIKDNNKNHYRHIKKVFKTELIERYSTRKIN